MTSRNGTRLSCRYNLKSLRRDLCRCRSRMASSNWQADSNSFSAECALGHALEEKSTVGRRPGGDDVSHISIEVDDAHWKSNSAISQRSSGKLREDKPAGHAEPRLGTVPASTTPRYPVIANGGLRTGPCFSQPPRLVSRDLPRDRRLHSAVRRQHPGV